MKSTKKTKKKLLYTVDLTKCEDLFDVTLAYAWARFEAGLALSREELSAIIEQAVIDFADHFDPKVIICTTQCECPKKKPWYKRLWNKLFGKKN